MGINLASNKLEKYPWRTPKYHIIAPLPASQIKDDQWQFDVVAASTTRQMAAQSRFYI
jgi:hypothetical protein